MKRALIVIIVLAMVQAFFHYKRNLSCGEIHSLRHTFATNFVNGVKQPDGTIKSLAPKQVADLLGHSTSQITELYYVKKDTSRLNGITEGFEM